MTVGTPNKGNSTAEKEKRYVKDTILYDLLEVDPEPHKVTSSLCSRPCCSTRFVILISVSLILQLITNFDP